MRADPVLSTIRVFLRKTVSQRRKNRGKSLRFFSGMILFIYSPYQAETAQKANTPGTGRHRLRAEPPGVYTESAAAGGGKRRNR